MYKNYIKRLIDLTSSTAGFLLLSPVFVGCTVLLAVVNGGKPFFFQVRPGKYGESFKIIKFKTMTDARDAQGNLLRDEDRLTGIGNFVRKTSLDEIPQLLNVIKGDMSLVGPRPLLVDYLPLYNEDQQRRHQVRPGITGWAQVNGRNAISWEQKFAYDVEYVDNLTFAMDVKILFRTVAKVFKREGIAQEGNVTMEKWRGSERVRKGE